MLAATTTVGITQAAVGKTHSASPATSAHSTPAHNILNGEGIGPVTFGESARTALTRLEILLKSKPVRSNYPLHTCNVSRGTRWPGFLAFFRQGRFVGYAYSGKPASSLLSLATDQGLRVGESVSQARHIYASSYSVDEAQGGSWTAHTSRGLVMGYLSLPPTKAGSKIATIEAGDVGCPAMTPQAR